MSGRSSHSHPYHHGFPAFANLTLDTPRLYHRHSSDESDSHHSSGGGGTGDREAFRGSPDNFYQDSSSFGSQLPIRDTPFLPARDGRGQVPLGGRGGSFPTSDSHPPIHPSAYYQYSNPTDPNRSVGSNSSLQPSVGNEYNARSLQDQSSYPSYYNPGHYYVQETNQRVGSPWLPTGSTNEGHFSRSSSGYLGVPIPPETAGPSGTQSLSSEAPPFLSSSSSQSSGFQNPDLSSDRHLASVYRSALDVPAHDVGDELRRALNIPFGAPINLQFLPTPHNRERPKQSLPVLVQLAIYGSPQRKLTLQEIYQALENRFEWYRDHGDDMSWKNSIRHNLSLNKVFRRVQRPITEPGKGHYWALDFSKGVGNKRPRKRNLKSKPSSRSATEDIDTGDDEDNRSSPGDTSATTTEGGGHQVAFGRKKAGTQRGSSPYSQGQTEQSSSSSTSSRRREIPTVAISVSSRSGSGDSSSSASPSSSSGSHSMLTGTSGQGHFVPSSYDQPPLGHALVQNHAFRQPPFPQSAFTMSEGSPSTSSATATLSTFRSRSQDYASFTNLAGTSRSNNERSSSEMQSNDGTDADQAPRKRLRGKGKGKGHE